MKLETSEEDLEWVRERVDYIRSQGGPFILDDRVYCDFLTLLAEVERLRAEYELAREQIDELETDAEAMAAEIANLRKELDTTPPAPPLPAAVEEMRQALLMWAKDPNLQDESCLPDDLRAAAALLSRWPGVWRPIETAPKDGTARP